MARSARNVANRFAGRYNLASIPSTSAAGNGPMLAAPVAGLARQEPAMPARRPRTYGVCLGIVLMAAVAGDVPAADEGREHAALRDYNAAAGLQNAGLYDRAVTEKWAAFVGQYPGDPHLDRAITTLGICQLHGKKSADAIRTFQSLLAKYPAFSNAESAQYHLGIARYQAAAESKKPEDFRAAAESLEALAAKYPQGPNAAAALYYQGESLLAAGDVRAAVEAYKRLLAAFPRAPGPRRLLTPSGTVRTMILESASK